MLLCRLDAGGCDEEEGVWGERSGGVCAVQRLLRSDVRLNKTVGEYWIPHSWSTLRYNTHTKQMVKLNWTCCTLALGMALKSVEQIWQSQCLNHLQDM